MFFTRLKYFQAVCRLGNYTKAAAELSVTQPAVSMAIKCLEDELGVKLLVRDGRTIQTTQEGEYFLKLANDLMSHVDMVMESMHEISAHRKCVRLGLTPMLAMVILPKLYREFSKMNPDIILKVTESPRSVLQKKLRQNQLDIIIVNATETLTKDASLRNVKIADFEYNFCVAKDHPLAGYASITAAQIGDTPLVCFGLEYEQPAFIQQVFLQQGAVPNIIYHANSISTIAEMVLYNHFGGFMYQQLAGKWQELSFIPMSPPLTAAPSLFWRKDTVNTDGIKKLIACLKTICL